MMTTELEETHGLLLVVDSNRVPPPEVLDRYRTAIDTLYEKTREIFDQGLIALLERDNMTLFSGKVVKFLDKWQPDYEKQDLVAINGINASTLFVCPVYSYEITGVTHEQMTAEFDGGDKAPEDVALVKIRQGDANEQV